MKVNNKTAMRRRIGTVAVLSLTIWASRGISREKDADFSSDMIKAHAQQLASESFLGRRAGTAFEHRAGEYVARQLDAMGIKPPPSGARIQSFPLKFEEDSPTSLNVLGLISPSKKTTSDELLVLGAHIDHLGPADGGGYFPGADDNASGVAVALEVARALQNHADQLRRPVIVAFFGAEEIGLIGSNRFVRRGPIDNTRIVAMVNIDMIGRPLADQGKLALLKRVLQVDSDNSIAVVGTQGRPFFTKTVQAVAARVGLSTYGTQAVLSPIVKQLAANRSDHSPFERVGIPTLFFSSGESDDYHRTSDTFDTLRPELLARRARFIYEIVVALASAERGELPARENALAPAGERVQTLQLRAGKLAARLRDNSDSPQVLSGLQSLTHTDTADFDAFDPDSPGSSAGLNFEHIISGHANRSNRFSPRRGRYELYRSPHGRSATLVRRREDSPWDISSTLTYTLRDPHYVDFEFCGVPRSRHLFGARGHAIHFFANYMNDVEDPAIHFLGVKSEDDKEAWISAAAPDTHPDWDHGGTYSHVDSRQVEYDQDHNFRLNSWSYDFPRFTKPFYYGRAGRGMVFMLMFDRAATPQDEIRFSLFKFKLPRLVRPAWDFQYVIHQVREGKEYGFRGRLVWKPWVGREDCLLEYQRWLDSLDD